MLWLAVDLPLLPLEALPSPATPLTTSGIANASLPLRAVTATRGSRRWVVCTNDVRLAPGIDQGIDWGSAQALLPELQAEPRKPAAERAALDALCAWAWRYGSEVVGEIVESERDYGRPQHRLAVNVAASLKLFGGIGKLREDFIAAFAQCGHAGRIGIAPTLDAAVVLARVDAGLVVTEPERLRQALAPLPLALLDLPFDTHEGLRSLGLKRIGELLALPADGLARRYGPALNDALARLLGARADGRPRHRLAERFSRRFDLGSEVETVEGLALPLRRLVQNLADYLRARDTGVQECRLLLEHAQRRVTRIDLKFAVATRDPSRLLRVVRERLDREALAGAVRALRLSASRFIDPDSAQDDLFDPRSAADWIGLLETLSARLGEHAVHALALAEDCRPERAWRRTRPEVEAVRESKPLHHRRKQIASRSIQLHASRSTSIGMALGANARPLWLLETPRELAIIPQLLTGPERLEGGWWDEREDSSDVSRDYYRTHIGPMRAWVFRDRRTQSWYLHGLFA